MNTLLTAAIATIKTFISSLQLKQAFIAGLACFFLFSATACGTNPTQAMDTPSYDSSNPYAKDTGPKRELYKPTQKREGGMNNYNDDPRYDQASTKAEAKEMVKNAERNLQKRATNPKEALDNARERNQLGNNLRQSSKNIGDATEQLKDDFSKGTEKGIKNLKANADRAKNAIPDIVDEATQNLKGAGKDAQQGAQDLARGVGRAAERATEAVQD